MYNAGQCAFNIIFKRNCIHINTHLFFGVSGIVLLVTSYPLRKYLGSVLIKIDHYAEGSEDKCRSSFHLVNARYGSKRAVIAIVGLIK